jgi:hypothetical protein
VDAAEIDHAQSPFLFKISGNRSATVKPSNLFQKTAEPVPADTKITFVPGPVNDKRLSF